MSDAYEMFHDDPSGEPEGEADSEGGLAPLDMPEEATDPCAEDAAQRAAPEPADEGAPLTEWPERDEGSAAEACGRAGVFGAEGSVPGEPAAAAPPEGEAKPEGQPTPELGACLCPDGLDSGLAWFGEAPFVPPVPPGRRRAEGPPEEEVEKGEAVPAVARPAVSLAERRRMMRERLDARRAETAATKKWYQRVPLPIWLCMPATIFIIVYGTMIIFQQLQKIPGSKERIASELLTAAGVEDFDQKLDEMRIALGTAENWQLLPSGELVMKQAQRHATVTLHAEKELKDAEVSCEVCLIGDSTLIWFGLDAKFRTALCLDATPGKALIRKAGPDGSQSMVPYDDLEGDHWYELKIRVAGNETHYFVNGYELKPVPARPASIQEAVIMGEEARFAIRRWTITPLE